MLINDGENGLLVPRGDARALADAVCRMIGDREGAVRMGKKATEVRERFKMEVIMGAWEKYITEIASR